MGRETKGRPRAPDEDSARWLGAARVDHPGAVVLSSIEGMIFHVYRASAQPSVFAITGGKDISVLPATPEFGQWEFWKKIPESGRPRIGFSEAEAKADILRSGYHLMRVRMDTMERVDTGSL